MAVETGLQEVKMLCQKVPEKPHVNSDFGTLAQWHFCILLIVILREFKNTYGIRDGCVYVRARTPIELKRQEENEQERKKD